MDDEQPAVKDLWAVARATALARGFKPKGKESGTVAPQPRRTVSVHLSTSHRGVESAAEVCKRKQEERQRELEARIRSAVKKRLRRARMEIVEMLFQREESLSHEFNLVVSYRQSRRMMSRRERRRSNHGPIPIGQLRAHGTFEHLCEEVAICDLVLGSP